MNRAEAVEKLKKLRALGDPTRGGTPAERATANRMADKIAAKYKIGPSEVRLEQEKQERPGKPYVAPSDGAAWWFDINTGAASKNVKVHHYSNRGSWRIEIT